MRQFTSYVKLGRNTHDDAVDCCTGMAEIIPYRSFVKPQRAAQVDKATHFVFDDGESGNLLAGEATRGYMDLIGGF